MAAADIMGCADTATFALTEVGLGLAPAIISVTVYDRMPPRAATLATLTAELFTGAEAAAYRLVTVAVPRRSPCQAVRTTCQQLLAGAGQGLRESKKFINADLVAKLDARGEEIARLSASLFASPEAAAAMRAFLTRPS